jgi:alkanesulfonate monooxygenase SsuD/methylene tetrahydromethanopterin reductase-like flavin-dependent oxidoreductase (luciferase family)
MVKEVYFFTEMGYTAYPQDDARRLGYNNLLFPNAHFSPERAQALYGMYFEELQYCTEAGFDGVMINEHHNNPLCMMPSVNVIGAILARTTRKGRIVFLGNVLPIHDNPLRVAEELAMIDILSGGRVVCGFVRGIGQESLATNTNPVYNRERFDEAHDLILKAWTTPGPFRWEGKHYHYRIVNPWVRPLQQPHPPIWIPGVASPESVRWAAEHRYPYVALAPALDLLEEIHGLYDEVAAAAGFTPTAEHRGYAIRVSVADSDDEAYEQGKHFFWQLGTSFGAAPRHWQAPPGYLSRAAAQGRRAQRRATEVNITPGGPSLGYEEAHATYQIVSGNPDTVLKKLQHIIDLVDPGYLILWGREGPMSHEAARRAIDLLGQEVIPALKAYQPDREKSLVAGGPGRQRSR